MDFRSSARAIVFLTGAIITSTGTTVTESDFQTFEAVGALVVVLDVDGRIVHWNHCCSDLTGYSLEEVRGRRLWDFALLPEEIEPVRAAFAALWTSKRPSTYTNYWVTKTGERRWIAFSHTLTTHPDGRVQYVVKTGIDQTESKQADRCAPCLRSHSRRSRRRDHATSTRMPGGPPTTFARRTSTWSARRSGRKN